MKEIKVESKQEIIENEIKKIFEFNLTPADFAKKVQEISASRQALSKENAEFTVRKSQNKARVDTFEAEINDNFNILEQGWEERLVDVTEVRNYIDCTVTYIFKGEKLEERAMTVDERQVEMRPVLAVNNKKDAPAGGSDIQDHIRAETHSRTKHSAVDGPTGEEP